MASLYTRDDSKFFWVNYRDRSGVKRQESTRLRWNNPAESRKARALEAQRTADEMANGVNALVGRNNQKGWAWVEPWMRVRYCTNTTTLERYLGCWQSLRLFLDEHKVEAPQNFLREHCFNYITWRKDEARDYPACHNTALLELKILRLVMTEAVIRGLATGNPCVQLGIEREEVAEKPELTLEHDRQIRDGFVRVLSPEIRNMLEMSFEIARHQGCRLSETRLDVFKDVDLEQMEIRFPRTKGKRPRAVTLHRALVPLFERLRKAGKRTTWEIPEGKGRQWASAKWWKYLDRLGLKKFNITHHCNRVTVITEMIRAGVPEVMSQKYVGHGSVSVHRLYQRLKAGDLSACVDAIAKKPAGSS